MYDPSRGPYWGPYGQPFPINPAWSERRQISKTASGLGFASLFFIITTFVLTFANSALLAVFGYTASENYAEFSGLHPILYYLDTGAVYCLSLLIPFFILMQARRLSWNDVLRFERTDPLTGLCYVLLGAAICLLSNIPANMVVSILQSMGFSGALPQEPKTDILAANLAYVAVIVIIPPIFEEFVFRGVILTSLQKYGDWFAILGSSILFALFHGNFIQIPFAFFAGLIMAFVVVRTRNLWLSMAIHFLNNAFSVLQEFLSRSQSESFMNNFSNYYGVALCFLGAAAAFYLGFRCRAFYLKRSASCLSTGGKLSAFFWNPGVVCFVLAALGESVYMLYV